MGNSRISQMCRARITVVIMHSIDFLQVDNNSVFAPKASPMEIMLHLRGLDSVTMNTRKSTCDPGAVKHLPRPHLSGHPRTLPVL